MAARRNTHSAPAREVWADSKDDHWADFKRLLVWMAEEGEAATALRGNGTLYDAVNGYLNSTWRLLPVKELERLLDIGEHNPFESKSMIPCIMLRPNERQRLLPVVAPKFIFMRQYGNERRRVYPEVRLRLALFYQSNDQVGVLGYRFEPPEGPREEETDVSPGAHDYAHFQYINGLGDGDTFTELVGMLPCQAPAWPIGAHSPASMLAHVYIGLYGARAVERCSEPRVQALLQSYMRERTIGSPVPMWYRLKNCPRAFLRSEHLVTWKQQAEYVTHRLKTKLHIGADTVLEEIGPSPSTGTRPYKVFWKDNDLP